jgi:hypothetical protein
MQIARLRARITKKLKAAAKDDIIGKRTARPLETTLET